MTSRMTAGMIAFMTTSIRLLMLLFAGFSLVGCANYMKRKECEKTNWYDHGRAVALRGDRLNADPLVNECRKVEADISESQLDVGFKSGMQRYCEPTYAYQLGKGGDLFSCELCDGAPTMRESLNQHARGITDYCQKSNAYQAGASGKKYQNVCSPAQEKDFLPLYRKGRKKYVEAVIVDKESLIHEKEGVIATLSSETSALMSQRNMLQFRRQSLEAQRSAAFSAGPSEAARFSLLDGQISSLDSQIWNLDNRTRTQQQSLTTAQDEREKLRTEVSSLRAELAGLSE